MNWVDLSGAEGGVGETMRGRRQYYDLVDARLPILLPGRAEGRGSRLGLFVIPCRQLLSALGKAEFVRIMCRDILAVCRLDELEV